MASKLKCPFCGAELQETFDAYMCRHAGCKICCCLLPPCIIESLMQAKQDLEKAKAGFLNIRSWCGVSGLSGYVPTICEQQIKAIEERIKND